jgi:hypothetical protein
MDERDAVGQHLRPEGEEMNPTVKTAGRTDLENLFQSSEILSCSKMPHWPFLAFCVNGSEVEVRIVRKLDDALLLPPETPLMWQWQGKWSSDWFQFTAGDLQAARDARTAEKEAEEARYRRRRAEFDRMAPRTPEEKRAAWIEIERREREGLLD